MIAASISDLNAMDTSATIIPHLASTSSMSGGRDRKNTILDSEHPSLVSSTWSDELLSRVLDREIRNFRARGKGRFKL